jgi:hypothetical protein
VGLWWLHPSLLLLIGAAVPLWIAWRTSALAYQTDWNTPKYFTGHYAAMGAILIAAFVVGTQLGGFSRERLPNAAPVVLTGDQKRVLVAAARWTFYLALAGYVVWAFVAVERGLTGSTVLSVVGGNSGIISTRKAYLSPVAGVTTLTQIAPVSVACWFILGRLRITNGTRYIAALVALATIRTYLNSERIALIEVVLPLVILAIAIPKYRQGETGGGHAWRSLVPLWIPVAVIVLFGVSEYQRTWVPHYRAISHESYPTFVVHRLGGYFATSFNNAVLVQRSQTGRKLPYWSLNAVWSFPLVSNIAPYAKVNGGRPVAWQEVLKENANPEYNNPGGLIASYVEFGLVGAVLFWLAAGLIFGRLYRSFRRAQAGALILYSTLAIGFFLIYGNLFWTMGRATPMIIAGLVVAAVMKRAARRAPLPVGAPAATAPARPLAAQVQ